MTEVEKKAADILGRVKLGTIGLTQRDGTPHVFTAFIAADELVKPSMDTSQCGSRKSLPF